MRIREGDGEGEGQGWEILDPSKSVFVPFRWAMNSSALPGFLLVLPNSVHRLSRAGGGLQDGLQKSRILPCTEGEKNEKKAAPCRRTCADQAISDTQDSTILSSFQIA